MAKKLTIVLDISQTIYGTGVSVYTKNLYHHLVKQNPQHRWVLFGGYLRRRRDLHLAANFIDPHHQASRRFIPVPPSALDFLWNRLHKFSANRFFSYPIDIFHASDWTQPPKGKYKLVTTIFDLGPLSHPSTPSKVKAVHRRRLNWVKQESDHITVDSRSASQEVQKILKLKKTNLTVIPGALPQHVEVKPGELPEKVKKPYIFAIGTNEPRKNFPQLIDAFKILLETRNPKLETLVIAGRGTEKLSRSRVIGLGFVTQEELAALYHQAACAVYPSLHEGFGLPILEAQYHQTPIVTSNAGSLPEVGGKGVVLVDPHDPASIAKGIKIALKNSKELVNFGNQNLKRYSWEKSAKKLMNVYLSLCK